tara:strand:+ start:771 stop:1298 length:528 start_codon:yes stop_codon:yes gene_type:complete
MKQFNIIVACDTQGGIGKNNEMPWPHHKEDMRQFRKKTIGNNNNCVIMGYNTFKSMNEKPLPKRMNYVLTRKKHDLNLEYDNLKFVSSFENLFKICNETNYDEYWIIGGGIIYDYFTKNQLQNINEVHVTFLENSYDCDVFFELDKILNETNFSLKSSDKFDNTKFNIYKNIIKL